MKDRDLLKHVPHPSFLGPLINQYSIAALTGNKESAPIPGKTHMARPSAGRGSDAHILHAVQLILRIHFVNCHSIAAKVCNQQIAARRNQAEVHMASVLLLVRPGSFVNQGITYPIHLTIFSQCANRETSTTIICAGNMTIVRPKGKLCPVARMITQGKFVD